MNSIDWIPMIGALLGGAALGVIFFGGLFWTTEHLMHCNWPQAVVVTSFATRVLIVVIGFYWLMAGAPARALAALLGFVVARAILVRLLGSVRKTRIQDEAH